MDPVDMERRSWLMLRLFPHWRSWMMLRPSLRSLLHPRSRLFLRRWFHRDHVSGPERPASFVYGWPALFKQSSAFSAGLRKNSIFVPGLKPVLQRGITFIFSPDPYLQRDIALFVCLFGPSSGLLLPTYLFFQTSNLSLSFEGGTVRVWPCHLSHLAVLPHLWCPRPNRVHLCLCLHLRSCLFSHQVVLMSGKSVLDWFVLLDIQLCITCLMFFVFLAVYFMFDVSSFMFIWMFLVSNFI